MNIYLSRFSALVTLIILFCLPAGCVDKEPSAFTQMPPANPARADPGQAQWLERQSLLLNSTELAKVVSGSNLSWMASPVSNAHKELFKHADLWLQVNPSTTVTSGQSSALAYLNYRPLWSALQENNIRGLYLSPLMSSGSSWTGSYDVFEDKDDPVAFKFSDPAGNDGEFFKLLQTANQHSAIIGSSILPATTGLGPDFFLAARNMRQYPGIYCMIEIPFEFWSDLPASQSEWDVQKLSQQQVASLSAKGLFAPAFEQEAMGLPGGWAATGEVRGIDGQMRRFAYRYYQTPQRAVLNWNDPSAAARRIMSGSIVRTIGELGIALAGSSFLPMVGVFPKDSGLQGTAVLEPGLTAASDVGQEIRRYGGWSWSNDFLPPNLLQEFMRQRLDFISDSLLAPAAEHALLTGNTSLLRSRVDEYGPKIDTSRLVHNLPGQTGVIYTFNTEALTELLPYPGVSNILHDGVLSASGAGLAAIALGKSASDELNEVERKKIQNGQEALAFFMAAQPGLFVVPAEDAVGALPQGWLPKEVFSRGLDEGDGQKNGVSLIGERLKSAISSRGIVAAPTLYPGLDVQNHDPGSFLKFIGQLGNLRDKTGVAGGRLLERIKNSGSGVIVLATELPDQKGILLAATNFSQKPSSENVSLASLPGGSQSGRIVDLFSGQSLSTENGRLAFNLEGWGVKAILIQPAGAQAIRLDSPRPVSSKSSKAAEPESSKPEADKSENTAAANQDTAQKESSPQAETELKKVDQNATSQEEKLPEDNNLKDKAQPQTDNRKAAPQNFAQETAKTPLPEQEKLANQPESERSQAKSSLKKKKSKKKKTTSTETPAPPEEGQTNAP